MHVCAELRGGELQIERYFSIQRERCGVDRKLGYQCVIRGWLCSDPLGQTPPSCLFSEPGILPGDKIRAVSSLRDYSWRKRAD